MGNAGPHPPCPEHHSSDVGAQQPAPRTAARLAAADLPAVAARLPQAEALRHKRHGAWLAWSWSDLATQVERLGQTLRARGLGAQSLVVVSGQYAPNLLLFALAAVRQEAWVTAVPAASNAATLAGWLERSGPDLVFLGARDQVVPWGRALARAGRTAAIVVDDQLPWDHPSGAGFSFAGDLLGPAAPAAAPARPTPDALWIEDSTDWVDGLGYLLHALASGRPLAFPESRQAASRDRREAQPTAMALSPARHAALSQELAVRLPSGQAFAARLTRLALAAGRAGRARWHHRLLLARLRRPLGLARLRALTVVGSDGHAVAAGGEGDLFTALGVASGYARPPAAAPAARPELAFA